MVDLHHHLLWGLDDGAKDLETSIAMARASANDGVARILCTPHANGRFRFNPAVNRAKVEELQQRLKDEQIAVEIGLGCDFHLSYDNIIAAKANPARFSVNGLGYLMVELPDHGIPPQLTETFYELQLAGLTPILTHPERNPTLQNDGHRLIEWMKAGVLLQVTGDSVTGRMGKSAQKMAHDLLAKRWVHFLATDAHDAKMRPPRLSEARDLVAKKYGRAYAESLVEDNPAAVFEGKPFEPVDQPANLYDEVKEESWWQRFLSR